MVIKNLITGLDLGIPLRMAFEEESSVNSKREGKRLQDQAEKLRNYKIPGTDLEISYKGMCTLIDGKVRLLWSEGSTATRHCPICGAGPSELAKRHGRFVANRRRLAFGFSPLHCRMKIFGKICIAQFIYS